MKYLGLAVCSPGLADFFPGLPARLQRRGTHDGRGGGLSPRPVRRNQDREGHRLPQRGVHPRSDLFLAEDLASPLHLGLDADRIGLRGSFLAPRTLDESLRI